MKVLAYGLLYGLQSRKVKCEFQRSSIVSFMCEFVLYDLVLHHMLLSLFTRQSFVSLENIDNIRIAY